VSCELQDGLNLLSRHAEFLHQLIDAHVPKIFKHCRNGSAGPSENPCAADFAGDAFHGGALRPIESCRCHKSVLLYQGIRQMATRKTAALASFRVTEADSGAHGVNGPTRSGITGVILMRDAHMEFLEGLLPRFGHGWTAGCEAIVTDNGGSPLNINYPADTIYAYPDVVDEDSQTAMEEYLQGRVSDRVSRFTVLRYLWTAWHASVPPEGIWDAADHREEDPDEKAMRIDARKALLDFVDLLVPESITTPEQALWGFKQAFILYRWERLKRLGHQYAKLAKLTSDDLESAPGTRALAPQ